MTITSNIIDKETMVNKHNNVKHAQVWSCQVRQTILTPWSNMLNHDYHVHNIIIMSTMTMVWQSCQPFPWSNNQINHVHGIQTRWSKLWHDHGWPCHMFFTWLCSSIVIHAYGCQPWLIVVNLVNHGCHDGGLDYIMSNICFPFPGWPCVQIGSK